VNTYIAASKLLRPDAVMGVPDIPAHKPGKNRMPKMAHRTEVWLETLLREVGGRTAVWAAVLPIPGVWQEEYLKTLSEHKDNLGGLVFHDSRLLDEIPESLSTLPRMALEEISDPHTLLEAVGRGVDVFTLPLLGTATDAGIALDFEFPGSEGKERKALGKDMWNSASFATDLAPLVEGCVCYACRCHHRAYINHLLLAKEMTAWVLLQIHNAHVLDRFFMAVRESIARGNFEKDVVTFGRSYEAELPEKTGEGPR
jgi:queuine tRNA-ribosyltransferase subunit QTRTD1